MGIRIGIGGLKIGQGSTGVNWSSYWTPPSELAVVWENDYAKLTWVDNTGGLATYEVWESLNGGIYTLNTTTLAGAQTCNAFVWQNGNVNIKIKARLGNKTSVFSDVVNIITPLVFKNNQSVQTQVLIKTLDVTALKTVNINWGDGTNVNKSGSNSDITKDYAAPGQYFIILTGDINYINVFEFYDQGILSGTLISKWCLPSVLTFSHFYNNGMIGDITKISLPSTTRGCHFGGNAITSDITHMDSLYPSVFWDIHISSTIAGGITGDLTNWVLPLRNAHIQISGDITGNLTNWNPWQAVTYGSVLLNLEGSNLVGDLSNWIIPDLPATLLAFTGCHFTKLPRGNFRNVSLFNFNNNNCAKEEVDAFFQYIDNYFTGGIVPLTSCTYTVKGYQGPTMTGNTSIASIKAKYVAAGFVATINVMPIELPDVVTTDGNTVAVYNIMKTNTLTVDGEAPPRVSEWRDQLGSGRNLVNATATTTQPWFYELSLVSFRSNTHYMQGAFALNQPCFMYMVAKQTNWANTRRWFDGNDGLSLFVQQGGTTPSIKGGGANLSAEETHAVVNTTVIVRVLFNGANSKLIVNNNAPVTWDCGDYICDQFILGNRYAKDTAAYVSYSEIIIRNSADSAENEAAIYNYLKTKYNVAD
jgi:hypothetical protein